MDDDEKVNAKASELEHFMELSAGSSGMKEMFDSHVAAGFTENQTLKFMAYLIILSAQENPSEDTTSG